ncbi:MAG: hypothetical protein Q7R79_02310, partial [bacterium]|nr:hypothetical protein [bacterium]
MSDWEERTALEDHTFAFFAKGMKALWALFYDEKKNILIVSHADPLWALYMGALGYTEKQAVEVHGRKKDFIKTAEVKKLDFAPLPHDEAYTLDLHRPYIDELKFKCLCGGKMKRVLEVFDCWFESGA